MLEKGYVVHGIKRRASLFNTERVGHLYEDPQIKDRNFVLHYGDLTDSTNLIRIIQQTQPDEIYNLGAQSHVSVSFESAEYTADVETRWARCACWRPCACCRWRRRHASTKRRCQSSSGWCRKRPESDNAVLSRSPYAVAKLFAYWTAVNYREAYGIYACNGILFNHESPSRGETFVTRKITRALANIAQGLDECLYIGNLDAMRDWGHAKDYVRMQWLMLQQEQPEDFVIATGQQISVREFIRRSAACLGITIRFAGTGLNEVGIVQKVTGDMAPAVIPGAAMVKVDRRYFRPAEVETLLGDPTKAKQRLGWVPEISVDQLINEMVAHDLDLAQRHSLLKRHGIPSVG